MSKLHIANTFFEWELEMLPKCNLSEAFNQHPIFRQLQFLPLLYASPEDTVLLCDTPEETYWETLSEKGIKCPKIHFLSDFSGQQMEIESWGASPIIAAFAKKHRLVYPIPDIDIVKRVNSKQFSFENSPKLLHATLLFDETQAQHWLHSFEGPKVLKTCYGVSGKGHLIIDNPNEERIASFLKAQWKKNLPVIAEPWVDRIADFSTQWLIGDQTIAYIGSTLCENDRRGQYRSNSVGNEEKLFGENISFLREHLKIVQPIIANIAEMGFFGNLGIDAMIYRGPGNIPVLQPVVEINARKTMGLAALMFQRRHHSDKIVRFRYSLSEEGYLPKMRFDRNLTIEVYS